MNRYGNPGLTLTNFTSVSNLVTCAIDMKILLQSNKLKKELQQMTKLTKNLYFWNI